MLLTPQEKAMARGDFGPGIKRCMEILVKFGNAMGAEDFVPIASAHTMPKEPPELLRELTAGAKSTGTFTTLHSIMDAFSPEGCGKMGQPDAFVNSEMDLFKQRQEVYLDKNFMQTYTCLPMLVGNLPRKGQSVSWIGSGAQLMVNSLIGARCNRDGCVINLASAMTGRTPRYGLHLPENRYGEVLVTFKDLDPAELTPAQFGAIGYHLGAVAGSRNLVIDGIPDYMELDSLKYLMAPLAVTGAVAVCHIVGMTPEARTLDEALGGKKPAQSVVVDNAVIEKSMSKFSNYGPNVDMVILGCPHTSVTEMKKLAGLLDGRKLAQGKRLWIGLPHQQYKLIKLMGYADIIESAGGVFASSCMAAIPHAQLPENVKVVATTSFKAAHYITGLSKGRFNFLLGDMEQCIDSITGGSWKGGLA